MPTTELRRRIDVPIDVYDDLERHARWLHIPARHLAVMYLQEALRANAHYLQRKPHLVQQQEEVQHGK